jgi:hypothetical protein
MEDREDREATEELLTKPATSRLEGREAGDELLSIRVERRAVRTNLGMERGQRRLRATIASGEMAGSVVVEWRWRRGVTRVRCGQVNCYLGLSQTLSSSMAFCCE